MTPDIRPAILADIPRLQVIEQASFSSDFLSQRQMKYHLRNPNALFWVCLVNDNLAGYILILKRKNAPARIYSVVVDRPFRGKGLARALLSNAIDFLTGKGQTSFLLEVDADDDKTIALYKSYGFKELKVLAGYYEDGRPALKMRKDSL